MSWDLVQQIQVLLCGHGYRWTITWCTVHFDEKEPNSQHWAELSNFAFRTLLNISGLIPTCSWSATIQVLFHVLGPRLSSAKQFQWPTETKGTASMKHLNISFRVIECPSIESCRQLPLRSLLMLTTVEVQCQHMQYCLTPSWHHWCLTMMPLRLTGLNFHQRMVVNASH